MQTLTETLCFPSWLMAVSLRAGWWLSPIKVLWQSKQVQEATGRGVQVHQTTALGQSDAPSGLVTSSGSGRKLWGRWCWTERPPTAACEPRSSGARAQNERCFALGHQRILLSCCLSPCPPSHRWSPGPLSHRLGPGPLSHRFCYGQNWHLHSSAPRREERRGAGVRSL